MRRGVCCLLAAAGLFVCLNGPMSAGGDEELKKIENVRKQLDDLREQEKARAKKEAELKKTLEELERAHRIKQTEKKQREEAERRKKEEADKKNHYAKIELRGKLVKGQSSPIDWQVATGETFWPLNLDNKKDLLEKAVKHENQRIVVTGTLSIKKQFNFGYVPQDWWPPIQPLTPQPWPNSQPWPPQPLPTPQPFPYPQPFPRFPMVDLSRHPTVLVESIRPVEP